MSEQQKQYRNGCRRRIVEHALQIDRLEATGSSVDKEGVVHLHCTSDVKNQIEYHSGQLKHEAQILLTLLTVGGEGDE